MTPVASAASSTLTPVTRAASWAFREISEIDEPISSELAATVWTLRDTWSTAVAATAVSASGPYAPTIAQWYGA